MILVFCELWLECLLVMPLSSYPAVMSIYDPSLGGINCDGDCSAVATGPLLDEYWNRAGACHPDLLGAWVYFPAIDFTMECIDTGGLVDVAYSSYYGRPVIYFDVLWNVNQPPEWVYWLLDEWSVSWP